MSLVFNDKIVNEFSGPTTIQILVPKKDQYEKFLTNKKVHLPVLIMFGDYHFSKDNICETKEDKVNVNIFDKEFLKLIDSMDAICDVNFYLEDFNDDIVFTEEDYLKIKDTVTTSYLRDLRILSLPCFADKDSDIFSKYCYAKKTKFEYVDSRLAFGNLEQKISYFLIFFSDILNSPNIDKALEQLNNLELYCKTNKIDIKTMFKNITYIFETKSFDSVLNIISESSILFEEIINKQKISPFDKVPYWIKYMNEYISFVLSAFSEEKQIENAINLVKICKKIFLTSKKLDEIKTAYGREKFAKNHEHVDDLRNELTNYKAKLKDTYSSAILNLQKFLSYDKKEEINRIFINTSCAFLDIFFAIKMLGNVSDREVLSIGYFGINHVEFLVVFLTKILNLYDVYYTSYSDEDYKKIIKTSKTKVSRCLQITKDIDIEKDLILKYRKATL